MPASISSNTIIAPPPRRAIASEIRDSSPPDAVSATPERAARVGGTRSCTSSAPCGPGSRSRPDSTRASAIPRPASSCAIAPRTRAGGPAGGGHRVGVVARPPSRPRPPPAAVRRPVRGAPRARRAGRAPRPRPSAPPRSSRAGGRGRRAARARLDVLEPAGSCSSRRGAPAAPAPPPAAGRARRAARRRARPGRDRALGVAERPLGPRGAP